MFIQPYQPDELHFAYCYRVYLRWRTHKAKPQPVLTQLSQSILEEIGNRYGIHVLETGTNETDVRLLVSLKPEESVSACASKIKGQISKWIREKLNLPAPKFLVSRGYFACTTGDSNTQTVDRYLEEQTEHHGYGDRPRPPVFIRAYRLSPEDEQRLNPKHAVTHLQLHVVLATFHRRGVFSAESGEAAAGRWMEMLRSNQAALIKVSFVPDHVHLALRVHPSVSPAVLIVELMNVAQELMWQRFEPSVIRAGVERLWQPSAYLGSFGELESAKISKYVKQWKQETERE